jgi:acetylornithine aminotransferase
MDYLTPTHLDDDVPASIVKTLQRHSAVTLNTYSRPSFILSKGKGCKVYDTTNREYLDFSGGIAVNALGHADEGVAKVLEEQSRNLVHCSNLWHNEYSGELAYSLVDKTKKLGGMGYEKGAENGSADQGGLKVFFTNSGTESNEGAIKFARKYGKQVQLLHAAESAKEQGLTKPVDEKVEIVSFRDGFHGRSMGALSATWQEKYQAPFAPLIPGFVPATLNDIEGISQAVTEKTCGVIVEPIQVSTPLFLVSSLLLLLSTHAFGIVDQGEGGILEASEEFLRALRKRCDEVGALLIFDEIQVSGRFSIIFASC